MAQRNGATQWRDATQARNASAQRKGATAQHAFKEQQRQRTVINSLSLCLLFCEPDVLLSPMHNAPGIKRSFRARLCHRSLVLTCTSSLVAPSSIFRCSSFVKTRMTAAGFLSLCMSSEKTTDRRLREAVVATDWCSAASALVARRSERAVARVRRAIVCRSRCEKGPKRLPVEGEGGEGGLPSGEGEWPSEGELPSASVGVITMSPVVCVLCFRRIVIDPSFFE